MPEHLTPEELQSLGEGIADEKRLRTFLRHLVDGCPKCRAALPEPFRLLIDQALEGLFLSPEEKGAALEGAVDRAFRVALRHHRHLKRQRKAGVRKVLSLLETKGIEAVERARRSLGDLAVFEALSEKSWSLRHEDPPQMLHFAREALKAAQRLDPVRYGPRPVADWQARAWAELGNAYRVTNRLVEAENCFYRALEVAKLGTQDEHLYIRLLDFQATLAADRRVYSEACWALDLVYNFYANNGDLHLAGRALISTGIYTGYAGHYKKAISLLKQGLPLVDEEREPDLVFAAVHNQLWFLVESGEYPEAKKFYLQNARLFAEVNGAVSQLKVKWLMARTYARLSEFISAEDRLREIKQGFLALQRKDEAALTSLDLADVLLSTGGIQEARELIQEAAQTYQELGIEHEKKVVLSLWRAAKVQQVELMHRIVLEATAFLRRAAYDPNARFEPEWWPPDPR